MVIVADKVIFFFFIDTTFHICGRPYVNSTVPVRTQALILSPGYPRTYHGPYECFLTIRVPKVSWIGVYTVQFQLGRPWPVCTDSLEIVNPATPENQIQKCGNITAKTLLYSDSAFRTEARARIRFHAEQFQVNNQKDVTQRFNLEYRGKL